LGRLVAAQRSARSEREAVEASLRELNVKAARALTKQGGLSLRDAGELLFCCDCEKEEPRAEEKVRRRR
jgi:hypothetical protein